MTTEPVKTVRVIDSAAGCPEIPIVEGRGNAKVLMWPGNDALFRTFQIISLEGGDRTIPLSHNSDAVYYVMDGAGSITDVNSGVVWPLIEGAMVHIDAGDAYRFAAAQDDGFKILGGPCPADETLYAGLIHSGKV